MDKSTKKNAPPPSGKNSALDTLAQLPPDTTQVNQEKNFTSLVKRARAKTLTVAFAKVLAAKPSKLKKSYLSSLQCASMLHHVNNKITGKYCNQRWCLVCSRIRTAKLIRGYLPQLEKMEDKYFVTVSAKCVPGTQLAAECARYYKNISLINRAIREKQGVKFQGLRKFECTYNIEKNWYHPHYHMIVDSLAAARLIVKMWLQRFPECDPQAQDIRPADTNACLELFKYFTKVVAKTGDKERKIVGVHTPSLDAIFLAVRGLRTFQPMGLKKVSEEIEEIQSVDTDKYSESALYEWIDNDWCDTSTGELLTNYLPSDAVRHIMDNII